jgi:hypothetical protein
MAVFTGNGSAAAPSITFSSDTNTGIYRLDADKLAIATAGANAVIINSDKYVGIAVDPTMVLDAQVSSDTAYSSTDIPHLSPPNFSIFNTSTGGTNANYAGMTFRAYSSTGNRADAALGLTKTSSSGSNGALVFGIRGNSFGPTQEGMRLTSDYRLGVGTTSPNELLEVAGNIHVSGADRSIFNRSDNALTFGTNNIERARIHADGRFMVGTSTAVLGADIQAATSFSVGGIVKREFSKGLGLSDNVETIYLTFAVPYNGSFNSYINIGGEISYVITSNRLTANRTGRATYGKIYFSIARRWNSDSDNAVAVDLVSTDKELSTAGGGGLPTITWAIDADAGSGTVTKNAYIKITVDNPNTVTTSTAIDGTVVYHTRRSNNGDVTVS